MSNYPDYQNKNWLHEQYIQKDLSTYKIAEIYGCSPATIWRWVNKFKFVKPSSISPLCRNKDWLYQKYIIEKKPASEISKECGCNKGTVRSWLIKCGIYLTTKEKHKHTYASAYKDGFATAWLLFLMAQRAEDKKKL